MNPSSYTSKQDPLEHAKHTVKLAIEQDEQVAIDWLESVSEGNDV